MSQEINQSTRAFVHGSGVLKRLLSSLALPKSADRLPCHPARSQVRRAPGTEKPPLVGTVPGNFRVYFEPQMRGGLSLGLVV